MLEELNLPIAEIARGPAGLQRLTKMPEGEASILRGATLLTAVTDPKTSRVVLDALAEYGDVLQDERFPESTRLTGAVLF